ncbi:MAG TPA: hypothetical protein PLP30_02370 [Clostridia bacterium]|nr:hypothetical protein [Clostridia bacterium]HPQ46192.1 hypothetical protein [Clostridia bacterium]
MKKKLLDLLLLTDDVYLRPLRKRSVLLALCSAAGLVFVLDHAARRGFLFLNNVFAIITAVVLVLFTGIFSIVMFAWPMTDLAVYLSEGIERFNLTVKRMKLVKGFLIAAIYTGTVAAFLKIIINATTGLATAEFLSVIISIAASLWAGAMITRCITVIFEETSNRKLLVFGAVSVWYYITVVQITVFIIKTAYSIIL